MSIGAVVTLALFELVPVAVVVDDDERAISLTVRFRLFFVPSVAVTMTTVDGVVVSLIAAEFGTSISVSEQQEQLLLDSVDDNNDDEQVSLVS
jgi:hypothetical protein